MLAAVDTMDGQRGFDAVIVCTSNPSQEAYWQRRLEETRGQACKPGALVVAVHEDWAKDGAGNGLGTLYAYIKARDKARGLGADGIDLDALIAKGGSVGLYHTAGKGTRLAPLPGSENNNKPGVKLPSLVSVTPGTERKEELTILEAVIRQTGAYAPVRGGRLSVFWGDQIFVPSAGHLSSGGYHADILSLQGPMPNEQEWKEKGLEKYGLIAVNSSGEATQVEKVDYATAVSLLASFGEVSSVGPSLGSFSVSVELLTSLITEFSAELAGKTAKMDSDPHFWMPLTLIEETYVAVMTKKGEEAQHATAHYKRMQALKARLSTDKGVFGCIDAGNSCYWWDFGMLGMFVKNTMLTKAQTDEAAALRRFLGIPESRLLDSEGAGATLEDSVVLASSVKAGSVSGSVCSHLRCVEAQVQDSVLINVTARSVKAKGCVIYNVACEDGGDLELPDGSVLTNVFMPDREKLVMRSTTDTDGGKVFKTKLDINEYSFDEVYSMNAGSDVSLCYELGAKAHAAAAAAASAL
mmetsp:Transcript_129816/g.277081  ORF Transcript_129816/g.277081 Transcript_129816/m.277081 type:complete len:524 (+) Transcript_129816:93-1664(+)